MEKKMIEIPTKYRVRTVIDLDNIMFVKFQYEVLKNLKGLHEYQVIAIFKDHEEDVTKIIKEK